MISYHGLSHPLLFVFTTISPLAVWHGYQFIPPILEAMAIFHFRQYHLHHLIRFTHESM